MRLVDGRACDPAGDLDLAHPIDVDTSGDLAAALAATGLPRSDTARPGEGKGATTAPGAPLTWLWRQAQKEWL